MLCWSESIVEQVVEQQQRFIQEQQQRCLQERADFERRQRFEEQKQLYLKKDKLEQIKHKKKEDESNFFILFRNYLIKFQDIFHLLPNAVIRT